MIPAIPDEAGFSVALSETQEVATITLNRPERRNCQTPETWRWLVRSVNALPGSVRVLVIGAQGPSFSAGLDRAIFTKAGIADPAGLAAIAHARPQDAGRAIAGFQDAFNVGSRPALVSIALVQGYAIGAGFQLALSCDIRIAAEDAQFAMAEVTLGLVPDLGGTKRLVELVGYSRAASICLTGRRVSASEADRIGLVSAVVPVADLARAGDRFVEQILALPRSAVSETKALLVAAADRTHSEQQLAEREAQYRQLRELAALDGED